MQAQQQQALTAGFKNPEWWQLRRAGHGGGAILSGVINKTVGSLLNWRHIAKHYRALQQIFTMGYENLGDAELVLQVA
jgi:hypothetical protein